MSLPLHEKTIYADYRAQYWLSMANKAIEKGKKQTLIDRYEQKAQYWLDRLNKLEGLVDEVRS